MQSTTATEVVEDWAAQDQRECPTGFLVMGVTEADR